MTVTNEQLALIDAYCEQLERETEANLVELEELNENLKKLAEFENQSTSLSKEE